MSLSTPEPLTDLSASKTNSPDRVPMGVDSSAASAVVAWQRLEHCPPPLVLADSNLALEHWTLSTVAVLRPVLIEQLAQDLVRERMAVGSLLGWWVVAIDQTH